MKNYHEIDIQTSCRKKQRRFPKEKKKRCFKKVEVQNFEPTQKEKTIHFPDASAEFLKHCQIKGLSPYTIKYYQKEFKQTIDFKDTVRDVLMLLSRYAVKYPSVAHFKDRYHGGNHRQV